MISPKNAGAGLVLFLAALPFAHAQSGPPDAGHGRELAAKLCVGCHSLPSGSAAARADVPSFAAIARMPNMTPERLAGAMTLPHPEMPGIPLTNAEVRDLIAFISSLRRLD